jgi:arylsulfatase A-like enzyme
MRSMQACILAIALLANAAVMAAETPRRPNLIVLMTDDQRFDSSQAYGDPPMPTPAQDRLGREGAVFRNSFCTTALCAPSRATLLTGQYSSTHGVLNHAKTSDLRADAPFMPEILRQAGYQVVFAGKSHLPSALRNRTWDYITGYIGQGEYHNPMLFEGTSDAPVRCQGYVDDIMTDRVLGWMDRRDPGKSFALFLWLKAPHAPREAPARHAGLFTALDLPLPTTWSDDPLQTWGKPAAFLGADNRIADQQALAEMRRSYWRCLVQVDENIGRLLDRLDRDGLANDSLVMHTSDNGFLLGEFNRFDKRVMHEPSIRIPLLMRWPARIKAGTVVPQMVANVDFAPTLLDAAGLAPDPRMQGHSMLPILTGQEDGWRDELFYEFYDKTGAHKVPYTRGVRTARWKLIEYPETTPVQRELYDLEIDPQERDNRIADPQLNDTRRDLMTRLQRMVTTSGAQVLAPWRE